jgi:hypothetical protein
MAVFITVIFTNVKQNKTHKNGLQIKSNSN